MIAASTGSSPPFMCSSNRVRNSSSPAAQTESSDITGTAIACEAPGARNSNLLPVKASGLVRLRSLSKATISGSFGSPRSSVPLVCFMPSPPPPSSIARSIPATASPR